MNVTAGHALKEFAAIRGISLQEVVDWVNAYVNQPHLFQNAEATEAERLASIRAYINWRLANSSNARIRASIAEREAA